MTISMNVRKALIRLVCGFAAAGMISTAIPSAVAETVIVEGYRAPEVTPDGNVAIGNDYLRLLFEETEPTRRTTPARTFGAPAVTAPLRAPKTVQGPERVAFITPELAGSIVIDTSSRRLYFVEGNGAAISYHIGVGREGYGWRGVERVSAKREWPDWRPPADMLARRPDLPKFVAGGPANPLGARALYLGNTLYRIHGSNEPGTIGDAASSGCFRMRNADVVDLYGRVRLGARVIVR